MDIKEIQNFVSKAKQGECEKEEVLDFIKNLEEMIDDINSEIADVECELMEMVRTDPAQSGSSEKKKDERLEELRKNRSVYDALRADLDEVIQGYKNFDKNRFFSNLRFLMKEKDVKIGQIEKEADVRVGYASRLEKEGNTSLPSIEFITTAAKLLEVSIDYLLNAKLDEVSESEKYILKFIERITQDTKSTEINWKRISTKIMNDCAEYLPFNDWPHVFISEETLRGDTIVRFKSGFYPEAEVTVTGNSYYASLPRTSSEIYIIPCSIKEEDKDSKQCYEIYLTQLNEERNAICSTLQACGTVTDAVSTMYQYVQNSCSQIQVDDKARNIMDAYMGIIRPVRRKNAE